ncbi:hypothetical protein [Streptomyces anthocyanicus]|uniref:hypothetical protein n=1 Tax=Streptomyces anthocyanicus TaxID=68174 RepID=UPI00384C66F1
MNDSLSYEGFFQGSKKAAHRAMDDHGRAEYDEFALHAGVAVERLAKAVLVSKNPIYIAEIRNADMMLHLGGHLQMVESKVRTVGAKDAIARLRRIGVLDADPQLDLLIEMRNGAAHASPDSTKAREMISPLAQTIETLLGDLDMPLDAFWERWTDALRAAVNEQEDEILREIQLRVTHARHAFEDRFVGLPPEIKERALKGPPSKPVKRGIEEIAIKGAGVIALKTTGGVCPACGGQGYLTFERERADDDNGKSRYFANAFDCYLCSFMVSGPVEMAAFRVVNSTPSARDNLALAEFLEIRRTKKD